MSRRGRYQGVTQIARYNARFYCAAPVVGALLGALAANRKMPRSVRAAAAAGGVLTAWWALASLLVSHWVYDRSPLYRWYWLAPLLPQAPRRWANLHCGLDESSAALREFFPGSDGVVLDFFDATVMSEPSIHIARATGNTAGSLPVDFRRMPFENGGFDALFVFFSAHEIRRASLRDEFFRELRRLVHPQGKVIVAEHPRDEANFLAFGPGFLHFWPRGEWRRLARGAGFAIEKEMALTPFVRVWVLKPEEASS